MGSKKAWWNLLAMTSFLWTCVCSAQTLPQTSTDALRAMTETAGVIFTGQVVAVRPHELNGVVEIEFAVEDAVRGVKGGSYTLREWAGLWPASDEPFQVGQQYLMLLHAPGNSGLSSPVGGMDGAIPIRAEEDAAASNGLAPRSVTPEINVPVVSSRKVDLSWVSTRAVRGVVYQPSAVRGPIAGPIAIHAEVAVSANPAGGAAQQPSSIQQHVEVAAVVDMLKTWEKSEHGGR